MTELIPLYPLAAVVFLGAGALFALQMARHLRVFATARAGDGHRPGGVALRRAHPLRDRPGPDVPRPGVGDEPPRHLLGLRPPLARDARPDPLRARPRHPVAAPLDGWLWRLLLLAQNLLIVGRARRGRVQHRPTAAIARPRRMTLSRDGIVILLLIGGVVATELFAEAFRIAGHGDPDAAWAFAANALAGPARRRGRRTTPPRSTLGYAIFFWANVLVISFFLAYLPRSKHLHIATAFFNTAFRKLAPRGELPPMDLEAEDARFGVKTVDGPRLEGPARRLHVHRVRPLPGRLPGLGHGQAAEPQDDDHGPAGAVGRGRGGHVAHPLDQAEGRAGARTAAATSTHRRRRDPVRRGLGLRDLRRLRRGLPGPHRARRQDRRPAPQPRARGGSLPGRAERRVHRDGAPRQPLGPAGERAARLDARPAFSGADRGRRRGGGPGRRRRRSSASTGSAARPRSTSATGASPARS